LAGVIIAWNVFQHFYPYFDVAKTDWPAQLPKALRTAANDAGPDEYQKTLSRLVAALKDGHGRVAAALYFTGLVKSDEHSGDRCIAHSFAVREGTPSHS
jgi:hypothetical protein